MKTQLEIPHTETHRKEGRRSSSGSRRGSKELDTDLAKLGLSEVWNTVVERKYKIIKVIAKGGYGLVVKARLEDGSGCEVAIKLIDNFNAHKYTLVKALRELQVFEYVT